MGEEGEAKREEGGRMGPWSKGGVRVGEREKWRWSLKGSIEGSHERTIYSLDWALGGDPSGLGRLVTGGGDGRINVYQMVRCALSLLSSPALHSLIPTHPNEQGPPPDPSSAPTHALLARLESTHGVSDVNHVQWCRLNPGKAAATLRALEGGEDGADGEGEKQQGEAEEEARWSASRDWFASAGDDGVVRVWKVVGS